MRRIAIEPLTKAAFHPFGDVIEVKGAQKRKINQGFATRFHDLAGIDVAAEGGRFIVSIFRALRRPRPIVIDMLERHPLGSQAFFPLSPHAWLVVVAKGGAEPDLASLRCFRAEGDQGVNYAVGTWHFPVLILRKTQDFLIIDRDGPGINLDERWFVPGTEVAIAMR
jgi:ureidoglycolate lyase